MAKIRQRILIALTGALILPSLEAQRFYPDDPLLREPRPADVKKAKARKLDDFYDFYTNTFGPAHKLVQSERLPAQAVNTLGEVPDSAWYTNRHGARPMSRAELARGAGDSVPLPGTWRIVSAKTDGVTPGFTIEDSAGIRYVLKFDPVQNPEMASAADVIGSKFFFALGYNTPENGIVWFTRDQLQAGAKASFNGLDGKKRALLPRDIDELLAGQPRDARGRYRVLSSRFISGDILGPFRYDGTRSDDPNDIVPHQRRRDLRGLRVFAAWLNHDDSRAINTLDSLVEENGLHYVKHYLIDFGATLGSASFRADSPRTGFEYLFDFKPAVHRFVTLGLWTPEWAQKAEFPDLPSVGRFESKLFDPDTWKPQYPNPAFLSGDAEDEFWAAKQVMEFRDEHIRAIVQTGRYSDRRAEEWVIQALINRRDKIGRASFSKVLPLDRFRVENGRLQYLDLFSHFGFGPSREYEAEWFVFDNNTGLKTPIPGAGGFGVPAQARGAEYGAARIKLSQDSAKTVTVFLRNSASETEVVGVERTHAQ
jgi:hypothetical protein